MLDFLPQKNKRQVILEYILRDLIFLFVVFFIGLLLLILFFLPSAIYSKYENRTIANQLETTQSIGAQDNTDIVDLVKKLNATADVLSRDTLNISDSGIIDKIISLKNKNISISSFSVSNADDNSKTISIRGISLTRDGLTAFNKALIDDGSFSSVNLPISDLIQDTNADFSMELVYKQK